MGNNQSNSSVASTCITDSTKSSGEESVPLVSLHGNLMRSRHKEDPMSIFEVVDVLGEGSMGSVSKVRKKDSAVGGSARREYVLKHKGCCFQLFSIFTLPRNDSKLVLSRSNTHGSENDSSIHSSTKLPENKRTLVRKSSSMISYGHKDSYYALKSIHLDRCSSSEFIEELMNEVEILKELDHPNIVRAIETFDYRHRLYIVLELCSGGDLYTRDPYIESDAAHIVKNLLNAVAYLHSKGIVHRDLKFENIMFENASKDAEVKIIDFGLSQKFAANEHLHDAVGTIYTMAPELLAGDYDSKADVWSIGVIAFMLLSSSMPFYGKDRSRVIKKIVQGKYHFSARRWKYVSKDARQFVQSLLQVDPSVRPSAEAAQHSKWLTDCLLDDTLNSPEDDELMDRIQACIHTFAGYGTLKKLGLMVVAYKSTTEEIGFLRRMFSKYDTLHHGEISLEEFKEALLAHYDYSDEEMETMYRGIDIEGTGSVYYIEFLAATLEAHGSIDEERLAEAFDRIDCDDTGYITVDNLKDFLGDGVSKEYLNKIIDEADIDKDHKISYDDFLGMWSSEDDEHLASARVDVKHRRLHRDNSVVSSISSFEDFTDSERHVGSVTSSDATGGYYFSKQKEMSVRGAWV